MTTTTAEAGDYSTAVRYLIDSILPTYIGRTDGATALTDMGNGCTALTARFGDERLALVITNGDAQARWHVDSIPPALHIAAYSPEFLDADGPATPLAATSTDDPLDWIEVETAIDSVVYDALTLVALANTN